MFVQGYTSLVKDTNSKAVINTNKTEYQMYMQKYKAREKQSDELRDTIKEINTLKSELFEIKKMLKEVIKK
jgi:cell division protein FtsX